MNAPLYDISAQVRTPLDATKAVERPCANRSCDRAVDLSRRPRAFYCTAACSSRARSARYRASVEGSAVIPAYRTARIEDECIRGRLRRAAEASAGQMARLDCVRVSVNAELPRTAGQIQAVRDHITALTAKLDEVTGQRVEALADAHQLARLTRHLFLTTGAPELDRPAIQGRLTAHLSAADRRQVPPAYTNVEMLDASASLDRSPPSPGQEGRAWR